MDLSRFTKAHEKMYAQALGEIIAGQKRSHWMWYIFPQIAGLGFSETAQYYAISGIEEAKAFLSDSYLGGHLEEICQALMALDTADPTRVFGWPDDLKLRSSMTLFAQAAGSPCIYQKVLDRFFGGEADPATIDILNSLC